LAQGVGSVPVAPRSRVSRGSTSFRLTCARGCFFPAMWAIIEPTTKGIRMPRSPTTTNGEGTADAGTDIKEGYVQASSRSGSQSPKVETIEGTLSRKQGTSCRSLAAQYAHSAPTLALRWPGQPGTIHGTSNRMPQTVHFASMRSSGVREMTVSSLPGRRSRVRRTRPIFLREATATVSATGRGMDNTEG